MADSEADGWAALTAAWRAHARDWLPNAVAGAKLAREAVKRAVDLSDAAGPQMAAVRGGSAGGVPIRAYTPYAAGLAPGAWILFLHGGGFVSGDLDTHDGLCRRLASAARARVVAADYRLAPEHPFPAAVEDAVAVAEALLGAEGAALELDPMRWAVAGDSAGGNLAAVVARALRGGPEAPKAQLLIYPWLQLAETNAPRLKLLEGHILSAAVIEAARTTYLADADPRDPRVSPLLADDLAGLAPAHIVTAGLDPLHAEGRAYADRLAAAGVPATHVHLPDAAHGFATGLRAYPKGEAVIDEAAQAVAARWSGTAA